MRYHSDDTQTTQSAVRGLAITAYCDVSQCARLLYRPEIRRNGNFIIFMGQVIEQGIHPEVTSNSRVILVSLITT